MFSFCSSQQTLNLNIHREHPCISRQSEQCRVVLLMLAFMQAFRLASPSPNNNNSNLQRKHNNQCRMLQHILSCWAANISQRRVMRGCNNNNSSNSNRIDRTSKHNPLRRPIQEDSHNSLNYYSSLHSQFSKRCVSTSSTTQRNHQPTVSIIRRRRPRRFPCDCITTRSRESAEIKWLCTWLRHNSNDKSRQQAQRLRSNISRNRSSCQLLPRLKHHKVRQLRATQRLL